jgi:hypothetical protein
VFPLFCSLLVFILFVRTACNDSHSDWSLCCNCCNIWCTSGFCSRPSVVHYVHKTTVGTSILYKCQSPSLCWQHTPFLFFSSGPYDSSLTSIQSTICVLFPADVCQSSVFNPSKTEFLISGSTQQLSDCPLSSSSQALLVHPDRNLGKHTP